MVQMLLVLLLASSVAYGMQNSTVRQRTREDLLFIEGVIRQQEKDKQKMIRKLAELPTDYTGLSETQVAAQKEIRAIREQSLKDHEAHMAEYREQYGTPIVAAAASPQAEVGNGDTKRKKQDDELQEPLLDAQKEQAGSFSEYAQRTAPELKESERFKARFLDAFVKTGTHEGMKVAIINKSNNVRDKYKISMDDIDEALRIFLTVQSDEAYFAVQKMMRDIDKELSACRGGKAGCFAYNFYNPAWRRAIQEKHRRNLGAAQLVQRAFKRCKEENEDENLLQVFGFIRDHLATKEHDQGRLLFFEMEKSYRAGPQKFFNKAYMNPRRVVLFLVAAVAVVGGAYYYFTRDY